MTGSLRDGSTARDPDGRRRPGELENQVLAVLWDAAAPMSPGQVQEQLGTGLAYATVSTILHRLETKGLVTHTTIGRAHHFEPTITQSAYVSDQVRRFLEHGDRLAVLQGFLAGLSHDDGLLLLALLDDAEHAPEGEAAP
jgi:predicted transcriptional regulator